MTYRDPDSGLEFGSYDEYVMARQGDEDAWWERRRVDEEEREHYERAQEAEYWREQEALFEAERFAETGMGCA